MTEQYIPKVNVAKELAEISKDFTKPVELVRETISNSIDASASEIWIEAIEDDSLGKTDLVIRIIDNGVGMTKHILESFFDLGYSTKRENKATIGEKGHGTKITYNSDLVTVYTKSIDSPSELLRATLHNPNTKLRLAIRDNGAPPTITFETVEKT